VMGAVWDRLSALPDGKASRTSWPGSLMERALALLAADFRRPAGPFVMAAVLSFGAMLEGARAAQPVVPPELAIILGILATAPIAAIRRFPGPAIGIVLTASAVFVVVGRLSWSVAAMIGWLVALGACPLLLPRRRAVQAVAATEVAVLLALLGLAGSDTPWDATAAEALAVMAAWGAGEMLRARRQSAIEQAAVAEQVRYLSARDVVARERASIARELHDVVAHHVSMIAVRAATAPYAITGLPEPGEAAFAEIADEARAALTELRVVLGVLRSPDGKSDSAPQPRIAELDLLLSRMVSAGTDVQLTVIGQPRPLPGSVELCCYRIVQEALTNAGRHAAGSQVGVQLRYQPEALTIRVGNGPAADRSAGLGRGAPGGPGDPAEAALGYGLTGLRERVAMLRGEFGAGPDDRGGFSVTASLPAPAGSGAEAT
jgi:signal transduction histidine kinase